MSHNQHNAVRPWTPGPWTADIDASGCSHTLHGPPKQYGSTTVRVVVGRTHGKNSPGADATRELILLAPEMAEAILACADWMTPAGPLSNSAGHATGILPLAHKLRALTADQEKTHG